ncbi:sensor histidine kinase [Dyella tabacisoli]|uniref:sensor histidine kinase n=1 Tax=Dyella tabacisoli TaxID=2282381 RepID=UPI0013B46B1E|nr:two-component regulator propeller domain-containing protein [Dyella tabacisoli]
MASLKDFSHTAWTQRENAPPDVWALAQTADGWLWLGTPTGLYRFDGVSFERYDFANDSGQTSSSVGSLLGATSGDLFIASTTSGTSVCHLARTHDCASIPGIPVGEAVSDFAEDGDGRVWALTANGLYVLQDGLWSVANKHWGLPDGAAQLTRDPAGDLWAAAVDGVYVLKKGARRFERSDIAPLTPGSSIFTAPDGALWKHREGGFTQIRAPAMPSIPISDEGRNWQRGAPILFDRKGGFWSVACVDVGICHDGAPGHSAPSLDDKTLSADTFKLSDGLSSGAPMTLLEDREGNVWVGTKLGIDRFRPNNVIQVALPGSPVYFALSPDVNGAMWVGTASMSNTLDRWWHLNPAPAAFAGFSGDATALFRDSDGSIFLGGQDGFWHFAKGRFQALTVPSDQKGKRFQSIARDGAGRLWVAFRGSPIYRVDGDTWIPKGSLRELPDTTPARVVADTRGRLWLGYNDNRLVILDGDAVHLYGAGAGLDTGSVTAILPEPTPLMGGERGLASFDGRRFHTLKAERPDVLSGITGLVTAKDGSLWVNGIKGAVRIRAEHLARALKDPAFSMPVDVFDMEDGMPGGAQQVRPLPTAVEGTDGKIWLAASTGLAWIDPSHITRDTRPPRIVIRSVVTDKQTYDAEKGLRLPARTTALRLTYSALSLAIPERVKFRYRLEGTSGGWEEAGSRREATYTNLGPGTYRFRVIARNGDGPWSAGDTDFVFLIEPTLYQTLWFKASIGVLVALLLFVMHRFRLRKMAAHIRGRLEERLRERERIARELHDTLIQDFQALILHMHTLAKSTKSADENLKTLDKLTDMAERALIEARDRVTDLRASVDERLDMATALQLDAESMRAMRHMDIAVTIHGEVRELHTVACEEIHAVGKEALLNAFKHANASEVSIHIVYRTYAFILYIRDNGSGINMSTVGKKVSEGHYGLLGMRERAARLNGSLRLSNLDPSGTEVRLRVPGPVAYGSGRSRWRWLVGMAVRRARDGFPP